MLFFTFSFNLQRLKPDYLHMLTNSQSPVGLLTYQLNILTSSIFLCASLALRFTTKQYFHKTNYVCKLNGSSSFLLLMRIKIHGVNSQTFSRWGQLAMIKRSNMIGPISKYTYLKIKLMNMVTKNFIRTEHIFRSQFENKFLIQFTIHV